MDKNIIRLKPGNKTPFEIEWNAAELETHALIRIVKEKQCKSLKVVLTGKEDTVSKTLPSKLFNQLDGVDYVKFSVEADFVSAADSFAELEVYTGTREEMILTEAELSFSASPFYISCNNDHLEFTIGEPGHSRIEVKAVIEKGFSVLTTLVHAPAPETVIQNYISGNMGGAEVIGRLYGRIKGRVNGAGFHERQEEHKEQYSENLNKTLHEGFHSFDNSAE